MNPLQNALFRQIQNRYSGVFRFGSDSSGNPIIEGLGTTNMSTSDAINHAKDLGISRVDLFKHGTPMHAMPHNGIQGFELLSEAASRMSDVTIERIQFDMGNARAITQNEGFGDVIKRTYGDSIFTVLDKDSSVGLRMKHSSGRYLTSAEIADRLGTSMGIRMSSAGSIGKLMKRLKAVTNIQTIESTFLNQPISVGVFDPRKRNFTGVPGGRMGADTAIKSKEGMSLMNPATVKRMAEKYAKQASELEALYGSQSGPEAVAELRRAAGFRKVAADLNKTAQYGGRFNIRAMNLQISDIDDGSLSPKMLAALKGMNGQLKGDVLVMTEEAWKKAGYGAKDLITSIFNIKKDVKMDGDLSHISLRADHISDEVRMDVQSFAGHPGAFDVESMGRETQRRADLALKSLRESGRVDPSFEAHLRRVLAGGEGADSVLSLRKDMAFASQIIDYMDAGIDIRSNPSLFSAAHSSIEKWIKSPDGAKKPKNLFVPDAIRAHVVDWDTANEALGGALPELKAGQITFRENIGWIMSNSDIGKYYEAFGGFDLDDALVGLVRWDRKNRKFRTVMYRSPGAALEVGIFDIAGDDDHAQNFLHRMKGLTKAQIENAPLPLIEELGDVSLIERTSMVNGPPPKIVRFLDALMTAEQKAKSAEEEAMKLFDNVPYGNRMYDEMIDAANLASANPGLLGQYSNARIALDSFIQSNDLWNLPHKARGVQAIIAQQEYVIDTLTQDLKSGDDIVELTARMNRSIGEMMAKSMEATIAAGGDMDSADILRIDPWLLRSGKRKTKLDFKELEAGIHSVNSNWTYRMFMLDPEDERAHFSRAAAKLDAVHQSLMDDAAAQMDVYGNMPDWLDERTFFDDTAKADARHIMDVVTESKAHYDKLRLGLGDEIADSEILSGLLGDEADDVIENLRQGEVLRAIASFFEDDGTMGHRAQQAVGAFLQQYGYGEGKQTLNYGVLRYLESKTKAHFMLSSFTPDELDLLDEEQITNLQNLANRKVTKEALLNDYAVMTGGSLELDEAVPEKVIERQAAREAERVTEAAQATKAVRYDRVTLEGIKDVWNKSPGVLRKGAIGLLALTAFSFGYQSLKDRSPEDLSGPPLLPGGSAYEDYPILPMPFQSDMLGTQMGSGVTYQIKASGNFDHDQFKLQAEAIAGAPSSGSRYRRGRSLGNEPDIFQRIKSNYG